MDPRLAWHDMAKQLLNWIVACGTVARSGRIG
jgi:hypothetical protein